MTIVPLTAIIVLSVSGVAFGIYSILTR